MYVKFDYKRTQLEIQVIKKNIFTFYIDSQLYIHIYQWLRFYMKIWILEKIINIFIYF